MTMPTDSLNIGIQNSVVHRDLRKKKDLEELIGKYESIRRMCLRQMPGLGFSMEQVEAAVATCDSNLEFYDEMLEKFE